MTAANPTRPTTLEEALRALDEAETKLRSRENDETGIRRLTESVLRSEERFRMLAQGVPNHLLFLDHDLRIVFANDVHPGLPVEDSIVLIQGADPGYDWLLARSIRGLVTMYGGANSHMAVRAAELGLPAAIGIGELLYQRLESARALRLDCASRTLTALS